MKTVGICFGGYCPLHQGHMDLIMRAKKENNACYVIVCGYDNEPRGWEINLNLEERYKIISEFFRNDEQIIVLSINDTELGLDESMSDSNWTVWQNRVRELIEPNCQYTWYVAEPFYKTCIEKNNVLGAQIELVDKSNPVSGTLARTNPLMYWNKITAPFKPYLCHNILVLGTASEGKSTLVKDINRYYDIPYAEEFGRTYMEYYKKTDLDLTRDDFEKFLTGQMGSCDVARKYSKNGLFISDTDNCVTLMYAAAYAQDPKINISQKDYEYLYTKALELQKENKFKWHKIFIFPPSKTFVDDGVRYMEQSSMKERQKNFLTLQKLINEFYPETSKTYLNGTFYENFCAVKKYIDGLV